MATKTNAIGGGKKLRSVSSAKQIEDFKERKVLQHLTISIQTLFSHRRYLISIHRCKLRYTLINEETFDMKSVMKGRHPKAIIKKLAI